MTRPTTLFCSWCHAETPNPASCTACNRAPTLAGRFALRALLGHGAAGFTWRAEPLSGGPDVAIKELSVRRLTDLAQLDHFEREAATLEALDHPGVPAHHERFTVEDARHVSLYLVQELVPGAALDPARRTDEPTVLRLLRELADVLAYLAARRPPVVHRDLKPANVMRRPDGRFVLIDFGATRAAAATLSGAPSVAGTFGYMAPEQLRGHATPASDVYGLGATAVALLAGRDASDLVDPHRPGAWRARVTVSPPLARLLERMLAVDPDARPTPHEIVEAAAALDPSPSAGALYGVPAAAPVADLPLRTPRSPTARSDSGSRPAVAAARPPLAPTPAPPTDGAPPTGLVRLGRDPVGQLGWLALLIFVFVFVGTFISTALGLDLPVGRLALWVVGLACVVYGALAVIGARRDPTRGPARSVVRWRRPRRWKRRTVRTPGALRFILVGMMGWPVALIGASLSSIVFDTGWIGAGAVAGLVALDQAQASLRHRIGWRRALWRELDAWDGDPERRARFIGHANHIWCSLPGPGAKAANHRGWAKGYADMQALGRERALTDTQREHVALVLLVCDAGLPNDEALERSLATLDAMAPRRATVEALLAAVDEAADDARAMALAERYLAQRERVRATVSAP